jgi:hypothetical protein
MSPNPRVVLHETMKNNYGPSLGPGAQALEYLEQSQAGSFTWIAEYNVEFKQVLANLAGSIIRTSK